MYLCTHVEVELPNVPSACFQLWYLKSLTLEPVHPECARYKAGCVASCMPGTQWLCFALQTVSPANLFPRKSLSALKPLQILRSCNVPFEGVNILADDRLRTGMKEYSSWPTFPQVCVHHN